MRPVTSRGSDGSEDGVSDDANEPLLDLMCGIGPAHIRHLCETETAWGPVRCYTPQMVGDMTLDEIFVLLCDRKLLRSSSRQRRILVTADDAVGLINPKTGKIRGRTRDGQVFEATVGGESLAGRLIREENERLAREVEKQKIAETRQQARRARRRVERQERKNGD